MTTLHATSKKCSNGYLPMIIARNDRGQCSGSAVCRVRTFSYAFIAETVARIAATNVARRDSSLRVR